MKNSFYVTLPSNVSSFGFYKENTASNYKTQLSRPLSLDDSWEVALTDVSYTNSWFNIRENHTYKVLDQFGEVVSDTFTLSAGYYPYIETIIENINANLKKVTSQYVIPPSFKVNHRNRRVTLNLGKITLPYESFLFPNLDDDLFILLGFIEKTWTQKQILIDTINWEKKNGESITGNASYDLDAGNHILMIYSDIVQASQVGDSYTQLLRVVHIPADIRFGDQALLDYANPYYMPLMNTKISTVEIDIKDDTGKQFPFEFGRTIVTLHFRKILSKE